MKFGTIVGSNIYVFKFENQKYRTKGRGLYRGLYFPKISFFAFNPNVLKTFNFGYSNFLKHKKQIIFNSESLTWRK